jgi:hypothetical protein
VFESLRKLRGDFAKMEGNRILILASDLVTVWPSHDGARENVNESEEATKGESEIAVAPIRLGGKPILVTKVELGRDDPARWCANFSEPEALQHRRDMLAELRVE